MSLLTRMRRRILDFSVAFRDMMSHPHREARRVLSTSGDRAALHRRRDKAFVELVTHAWHHVPYYRRVMEARNIHPSEIRTIEDLDRFPVLTKEDVRAAGEDLRSRSPTDTEPLARRSGGTTGEPICSYVSPVARALESATLLRGWEWMGWGIDERLVFLFGGSLGQSRPASLRGRLRKALLGAVLLPAFELGPENAHDYMRTIRRARPSVLVGYASALHEFALYVEAAGAKDLGVARVFSTAELLPDDWADRMRRVFQAPVQCYYGCGEVNSLGFQITDGGPYVIPDEHVVLEGGRDGEAPGALRVTALYNRAQPLIRYEMGDLGVVSPPGVDDPFRSSITHLVGRTADVLRRTDGSAVSASLAPHLIFVTGLPVRRYQIVQRKPGQAEFRYELDSSGFGADALQEVIDILREHLGRGARVTAREVSDDFIVSPTGKHRIVVRVE